ncbi:MAG: ATP synthase F1 subunit gamma [Bacteroidetes bacterium]|nr:ATP synthase F1 subunit gamma [Bacteroidota bacterium]
MAGLKEVRIRIASVKSTQQITSAMKMVSASKLKRAQNAILKMRPYAGKLREILENLSTSLNNSENIYSNNRKVKNVLIVVVTSNRGLCGAFNSNVIKEANNIIRKNYAELAKSDNVEIMCIGKKGAEFFTKRKYNVVESNINIFDSLNFENVVPIAEKLMKAFTDAKYDKIEIVYNKFKNAAVYLLSREQFLPIIQSKITKEKTVNDYIFEPGKEQIVSELIPKSLKIQLYKILLDSYTSEHGARMTAMHKATDNADSLLKELRLNYNKARQSSITNEILEIVSGAEALKG